MWFLKFNFNPGAQKALTQNNYLNIYLHMNETLHRVLKLQTTKKPARSDAVWAYVAQILLLYYCFIVIVTYFHYWLTRQLSDLMVYSTKHQENSEKCSHTKCPNIPTTNSPKHKDMQFTKICNRGNPHIAEDTTQNWLLVLLEKWHNQLIDYQNGCNLIFFISTDWFINSLFQHHIITQDLCKKLKVHCGVFDH